MLQKQHTLRQRWRERRVPMGEGRADGEGCADNIPTISTALFGQGAVLMGKAVLILGPKISTTFSGGSPVTMGFL